MDASRSGRGRAVFFAVLLLTNALTAVVAFEVGSAPSDARLAALGEALDVASRGRAAADRRANTQREANARLEGELVELRGRASRLHQLKASLEKDIGDLRQNFAETRKQLTGRELGLAMPAEPPGAVPAIDARVFAVKNDVQPGLVLLSVGSEDKVVKGFHFSIYRGDEFVGKVVAEKVLKDSCGCRVLFTVAGASIQTGDSAATRLQ